MAGRTDEKSNLKAILQRRDQSRNRRLSNPQIARRRREGPGFDHPNEDLHRMQPIHHSPPIYYFK